MTTEDVESAIQAYQVRAETPKNSVMYKGPGAGGRVLKVWVVPDDRPGVPIIIKSVAWEGEND